MRRDSSTSELSIKLAKTLFYAVEEAVTFYHAIKNRQADAVFWNNIVPKKEAGARAITTLLANEKYTPKRESEIREILDYWNKNYEDIRKEVFYRDRLEV